MRAGEIEVFVKDRHLRCAPRKTAAEGHKALSRRRRGSLAFEALCAGRTYRAVFKRDAESGCVDQPCIGFESLRKPPRIQSIKVGTVAGLGMVAGTISVLAGWRRLKGA